LIREEDTAATLYHGRAFGSVPGKTKDLLPCCIPEVVSGSAATRVEIAPRFFHSTEMEKQGPRVAVKRAFTDSLEWLEAISPVETDRFRLGVRDDTNATQRVAVMERERQNVAEKRAPTPRPCARRSTPSRAKPQDLRWVAGRRRLKR
jgi:hypothetical protein